MRTAAHLVTHLPVVGLQLGRAVVTPACPGSHLVTAAAVTAAGCALDPSGNIEVLRALVGDEGWAQQYTLARVQETLGLFQALAGLRGSHAAFYLARYQLGRLSYMLRTTPRALCAPAMGAADSCLRAPAQGGMGGGREAR